MSDYKIGYGRPPEHTRFKPGQSGNPRGRKKGSKNLESLITKFLDTKVTIETNDGIKRITKREAITMRLVNQAVSGDIKALQILLPMIAKTDERNEQITKMLEDLSSEDNEILQGFINGQLSGQKPSDTGNTAE